MSLVDEDNGYEPGLHYHGPAAAHCRWCGAPWALKIVDGVFECSTPQADCRQLRQTREAARG